MHQWQSFIVELTDQIANIDPAAPSAKPIVRTPSKPAPPYNPSPYRQHTTAVTAETLPLFNPYLRYSFAAKPSAPAPSAKVSPLHRVASLHQTRIAAADQ